jgi:hypothetical protein
MANKLVNVTSHMNSDIQQVVNTCILLKEAGKKPSVGMIKARLMSPQPIPIIIKGLSYWKENQASLSIQEPNEKKVLKEEPEVSLLERVTLLENELSALKNELKTLKQHFVA